MTPGANVSAIARAHGLRVQQVFRWRREAQDAAERLVEVSPASRTPTRSASFVEVSIEAHPAITSNATCEIAIGDVLVRIGAGVPAERIIELIRAVRSA
jgi:transposase